MFKTLMNLPEVLVISKLLSQNGSVISPQWVSDKKTFFSTPLSYCAPSTATVIGLCGLIYPISWMGGLIPGMVDLIIK